MGVCSRYYKDRVPEGIWRRFYEALSRAGRLDDSFAGRESCSFDDFMEIVALPDRYSWILAYGPEMAGIVYLSELCGTNARLHFAFIPTVTKGRGIPVPVAIGRFIVASILRDKDKQGKYILDSLFGLTPAYNEAAIKTASRCGGRVLGMLPGACLSFGAERNVAGVVTYYTRETAPDSWRFL
jgi:hypothetical protein